MSNIVRKGDFLVFVDLHGREEDLLRLTVGQTGRMLIDGCFGFRLRDNFHYVNGVSYWINRKATLEERDEFLQWMEKKGHKFNLNTLELILN